MINTLSRNWWTFIGRGLFAILFGALALALPQLTLIAMVWMFGAYITVDGLFQVVSAITRREEFDRWWLILLEGIFGVVFGLITFVWPGITALVLFMMAVVWAFVTGVLEIAAAIQLRRVIENEWLLAFSGILSIILGVAMLVWPGAGVLAFAWLIGIYAIIFGITLIALGIRLKNWEPGSSQVLA
jgi:uncharacterized membrane protein HdeD (DUF308 family)